MPHEMETRLVDGRIQRVYKNLWPSLRDFWIYVSNDHRDSTYIVFENQRWTYGRIADRAAKAASIYRHVYGVQKGDRVAICSRNFPDFLVAWWACHLIGAVSVLVNA
jgi:acyl-CoA synthetase (AMP-forming)/AMP-acid ligase II